MVFGPIIIAAAGTAVGAYFQERKWQNEHAVALRQAAVKEAREIFDLLSTKMDRRYNLMQRVWGYFRSKVDGKVVAVLDERAKVEGKVGEIEIDAIWTAYKSALLEWYEGQNKNAALILVYFGEEASALDDQINAGFYSMNLILAEMRHDAPDQQRLRALVERYHEEAKNLKPVLRQFDFLMAELISQGTVATFRRGTDHPQFAR